MNLNYDIPAKRGKVDSRVLRGCLTGANLCYSSRECFVGGYWVRREWLVGVSQVLTHATPLEGAS